MRYIHDEIVFLTAASHSVRRLRALLSPSSPTHPLRSHLLSIASPLRGTLTVAPTGSLVAVRGYTHHEQLLVAFLLRFYSLLIASLSISLSHDEVEMMCHLCRSYLLQLETPESTMRPAEDLMTRIASFSLLLLVRYNISLRFNIFCYLYNDVRVSFVSPQRRKRCSRY